MHAGLGAADGRQQRGIDEAVGLLRRAADRAHHLAAGAFGGGEVVLRDERLAFLAVPGREEQLLQLGHHGPLQLQVGVAPPRAVAVARA